MTFERQPDGGIKHVTATSTSGGFLEDAYNTVERTGKYRGQVIETVTYAVSPDGKTLTATQMGTQNGTDVSSVQVFTRQ